MIMLLNNILKFAVWSNENNQILKSLLVFKESPQ
jgi:hypothetical protein